MAATRPVPRSLSLPCVGRMVLREPRCTVTCPPLPCVEVLDDPIDPRSHWNHRGAWWGHGDWPQADGVQASLCWGEEAAHWAWTSRGLHDRALRMRVLYDVEPFGVLRLPGGPRVMGWVRP